MSEFERIRALLSERGGLVRYVMAPFVQADALEAIVPDDGHPTVIVTRWLADDLRSGASDLGVFPLAQDRGWKLLIHPRIHLKTYSWDLRRAIVGSANVTKRGLGLASPANEELMVGPLDLELDRTLQLHRLLLDASLVNEQHFNTAMEWLAKQQPTRTESTLHLGLREHPYLISALPMSETPQAMLHVLEAIATGSGRKLSQIEIAAALHDAANFGYATQDHQSNALERLRENFFDSPFIRAIESSLQPCIHFGALKAWIQQNCDDVPVPSRRDLTGNVQTLMQWFARLDPSRYRIDVPGARSERLCNLDRLSEL